MYNAVVFGVSRHQHTGVPDRAWKRNAATAIIDVPHKRGREIVLATETGGVMRLRDYRNVWYTQVDAPATLLAVTRGSKEDGADIAAALATGDLVLIDANGKALERFHQGAGRPTALQCGDLDGDGRSEIVLAREDGGIFVLRR
jgi:hypothetical protein